ncbi:Putative serine/threonine-protein kinase [Streptomyces venezuelae]|nr:Putative serine/threonine-protein kinase [Streptomyces venezuelae]
MGWHHLLCALSDLHGQPTALGQGDESLFRHGHRAGHVA